METPPSIQQLALDQHGVITTEQLKGVLTRRQRLRALADGWLSASAPGIYVVAGAPTTTMQRLQVGLLRLGPDAVVSHESAGHLHGFDRSDPDAVEFTVLRARRGSRTGLNVHTTEWGRLDVVRRSGLPCTSATRTILDLARAGITRVRLEAAIDSAVRSGATSPVVLGSRLTEWRGRGHWGSAMLDGLLPDSGGHTPLERRFLALVRRAGLPRPRTQVVHRRGTRTAARVDFEWTEQRLVVEVSGRLGHRSDAEAAKDALRRNELQSDGYRVYEFTSQQIVNDPATVTATMRRLLAA